MLMLHFFSFVGILPFLDDIQIISSKTCLPRETYVSFECSLSLCCPFPSLSVKFPNPQTLLTCKERSRGMRNSGVGAARSLAHLHGQQLTFS